MINDFPVKKFLEFTTLKALKQYTKELYFINFPNTKLSTIRVTYKTPKGKIINMEILA